jgi:cell wall-associated NlpC family hydrolase
VKKLLIPAAVAALAAGAAGSSPAGQAAGGGAPEPAAARAEVAALQDEARRHARRLGLDATAPAPAPRSAERLAGRAQELAHVVGFLRERRERAALPAVRDRAPSAPGAFGRAARHAERLGLDRPPAPSPAAGARARADEVRRWRAVSAWLAGRSQRIRPAERNAAAATAALGQLGVPYSYGGGSPSSGFDCSGLVSWAYAQVGVGLPHNTNAIWGALPRVPAGRMRPGDMVFFSGLGHMGIYIGDGRYVHAPRSGEVVEVARLDERDDFLGAVRA